MPLYEYKCTDCGEIREEIYSRENKSDKIIVSCENSECLGTEHEFVPFSVCNMKKGNRWQMEP